MNRRDFVCGSVVATGVGAANFAIAASPAGMAIGAAPGRLPHKVVFDLRFEAARAFAAGAVRLGCTIEPIAGDVTALWFNDLHRRWTRGEGAVVGMTTRSSLFCLEQLAWSHWLKVLARVEHSQDADGTARHRLYLDGPELAEARSALATSSRWPEQLVSPLVRRLGAAPFARTSTPMDMTGPSSFADRGTALVSWVISG